MDGSILLTRNAGLIDQPLWIGNPVFSPEEDHLYCLGANFLFWDKDESGFYSPVIVCPVDLGVKSTRFDSIRTKDPGVLMFLPGKTLDVLLERNHDYVDKVKGYIIKDGSIVQTVEYTFGGELGVQLHADKYLIILFNDRLELINIHYPKAMKKLTGIPPDGSLAVFDDAGVIWSREKSQRVVIDLDTFSLNTAQKIDFMAADEVVKAVSLNSLVTTTPTHLRIYNSCGQRVLDRPMHSGFEFDNDGVIDSHHSQNIAVSVKNTKNDHRIVFWFKQGCLQELDVGVVNARSVVIFRDSVYISYDELELLPIGILPLQKSDMKKVYGLADYKEFRIHRYIRVSPTNNWTLTVDSKSTPKSLTIRGMFGRELRPFISTKTKRPKDGPLVTFMDVLPAYLYQSGGIVRAWICETMNIQKQTNLDVLENRTYKISLHTWDKITEDFVHSGIEYELFTLPKVGFHARWFKTEKWVVLSMGHVAYVFDHEGARHATEPFKVPNMTKIKPDGPIGIVSVRGFGQSLWFLCGYENKGVLTIWQAMVWDGGVDTHDFELPDSIEMENAVATGKRRSGKSGRSFEFLELIISSLEVEEPWFHLTFNANKKQYSARTFYDYKEPGLLCSETDPEGRVYFSRGHNLIIYIPGIGSCQKFSDILSIDYDQVFRVRSSDNYIRAIQVGLNKVWVATADAFYCLDANLVQQRSVKDSSLPTRPVLTVDLRCFKLKFQVPSKIVICPPLNAIGEREVLFENDNWLWLSSRPMCLYTKPDLLKQKNHPSVISLESGRLLVLSTHIEEQTQQKEIQQLTETETQENNGLTKKISYILYEVLI